MLPTARNILYRRYFVRKLKQRFREKLAHFPGPICGRRSRSRPNRTRFRRRHYGAELRLPQCGRLLLPGQRFARHRGDSRANVTDRAEDDPMVPPRLFRSHDPGNPQSRRRHRPSTAATARLFPPILPSATGRKPGWWSSARPIRNCSRRPDKILVAPIAGLKGF